MVEQGTHKPLDVGSNPTLATNKSSEDFLIINTCCRWMTSNHNLNVKAKSLGFYLVVFIQGIKKSPGHIPPETAIQKFPSKQAAAYPVVCRS